ncbi:hypothetical protein, partial [Cytobacillus oceanisediminis]|uniref:hypothetical protein n=1 Tax=Cytobacillus oceanisediminis TaxID=665099 RepID=UPI001C92D803
VGRTEVMGVREQDVVLGDMVSDGGDMVGGSWGFDDLDGVMVNEVNVLEDNEGIEVVRDGIGCMKVFKVVMVF